MKLFIISREFGDWPNLTVLIKYFFRRYRALKYVGRDDSGSNIIPNISDVIMKFIRTNK